MKVSVIPPAFVAQRWKEVAEWIAPALEHAPNDYKVEHVQVHVSSGSWMLMVIEDSAGTQGAAVVEFINRPMTRVAFFVAAGGKHVSTPDVLSQMKAICKQYGATHLECAARESAARLWRQLGYTEKYRVMEMPL